MVDVLGPLDKPADQGMGFDEETTLSEGLESFLSYASEAIARGLTEDPSDVITDPIKLPKGVGQERASARLAEMASVVANANSQLSVAGARTALSAIFGEEINAVSARKGLRSALGSGDAAAVAAAVDSPFPQKETSSYAVGGN